MSAADRRAAARPDGAVAASNADELEDDAPASASELAMLKSMKAQTKALLDKQPKVKVRCQMQERVQINGVDYVMAAGQQVEVPEAVAQILWDSGRA